MPDSARQSFSATLRRLLACSRSLIDEFPFPGCVCDDVIDGLSPLLEFIVTIDENILRYVEGFQHPAYALQFGPAIAVPVERF